MDRLALEMARRAAGTDATIDATGDLIDAAGSYTAALIALAGYAAASGRTDIGAAIERALAEVGAIE